MRVLLLNPPGRRQYLRDYYCSTVSKAGYLWHPVDLLIQSGFLGRKAELTFLDAIAERLSFRQALERIGRIRPEVIFSQVGAQSLQEDMRFLSMAAERYQSRIAVSGEPVLDNPAELLEAAPWLSAVVRNFATGELENWIAAGAPRRPQVLLGSGSVRTFSYPLPRHSMFRSRRYRVPFDGGRTYASVLSTYGCSYQCSYCNSGKNSIGFALRPLEEFFDEVEAIERLGDVRHLFFRDMTFTAPRRRAEEICAGLLRRDHRFTWNCYGRPDNLDAELCGLMARAGCRLVQMGVETFDRKVLRSQGRDMSFERIAEAFRLVRHSGMLSGAHFLMGLPGATRESIQASLEKVIALNPDYVSINILQRRYGSSLSGVESLPDTELQRLDRLRRSAYRRYYLRPGYLKNLVSYVKSRRDLWFLARSAATLAWRSIIGEERHRRGR